MPQQARSGIAHSGLARSNSFTYNVAVSIAGVDRTSYVKIDGGLTISKAINNQPNTATILLKPGPFLPLALQPVVIALGALTNADPLFTGQVVRVARMYLADGNRGVRRFIRLECVDNTKLFNRRLVTQRWQNVSATKIAADIVDVWTSGFTRLGLAANLPIITDFQAIDEQPMSVLQRLVALFGGTCYLKAADLHLYSVSGDMSPNAGTNPYPLTLDLRTLKAVGFTVEEDASQLTTRSIVEGQRTSCPIGTPDGVTTSVLFATGAVEYLVVGGGGAGGAGTSGGGGGGGGRVLTGTYDMPASSATIVVGPGGFTVGANGFNSAFGGFVAPGGGGGGGNVAPGHLNGSDGGSGGGGYRIDGAGGAAVPGPTGGLGSAGGRGNTELNGAGGGGGGAAAGGGNASAGSGGVGGAGVASGISGTTLYYGGGGGGNASFTSGGGGIGGGGNGGAGGNPSTSGATNTGGGGGGSSDNFAGRQAGGSGVVIVRYLTGTVTATGGTITTAGGYTIHTFTGAGTFTLSTITIKQLIPGVTDLPLDDASQIDPTGGTVRIGTQIVPYVGLFGPTVVSGSNLPGSTVSSAVGVGITFLPVADITVFTDPHGWVNVGGQIIRYEGKSGTSLQGIPSLGFGSLTSAVAAGQNVTWLGSILLSAITFFNPALPPGVEVVQRVAVQDMTATTGAAAREGGAGVHDAKSDVSGLTIAGATAVCSADLMNFSAPLITAGPWTTEDLNAEPGRQQTLTVDDEFGSYTTSLVITKVSLTFSQHLNRVPFRVCEAASTRVAALLDAVVTR